ncbi:hypothetical protein [Micromonospora sp. NPDC005189]|uniref:hypothetical protein n=1 Tax=Micromonospora sp. NPDC005189 TaxID=3157019 RepID=UPI0033B6EF50
MGHPDHVVALVERPALRLKDWAPGFVTRRSSQRVPVEQQTAVAEEPPGTPPVQVGGPTEELPQQPATLVSGR